MNATQKQARASQYLAEYETMRKIRLPVPEEMAAADKAFRLLRDAPLFIPEFLR